MDPVLITPAVTVMMILGLLYYWLRSGFVQRSAKAEPEKPDAGRKARADAGLCPHCLVQARGGVYCHNCGRARERNPVREAAKGSLAVAKAHGPPPELLSDDPLRPIEPLKPIEPLPADPPPPEPDKVPFLPYF